MLFLCRPSPAYTAVSMGESFVDVFEVEAVLEVVAVLVVLDRC
jgi:hypothetical protein